jgi:WD40 repeat protein
MHLAAAGDFFASGSDDCSVRIWNVARCIFVDRHTGSITSLALSHDGTRVASGDWEREIHLCDIAAQTTLRLTGHDNWVSALAFSHDGATLVSGSADNTLRTWDGKSGVQLRVFRGHENVVFKVAFSPDDAFFVSTSWDDRMGIWGREVGAMFKMRHYCIASNPALAYSSAGVHVAEAASGSYELWNVETGAELRHVRKCDPCSAVAFSPDLLWFATGNEDGVITLHRARSPAREMLALLCAALRPRTMTCSFLRRDAARDVTRLIFAFL